MTSNLPNPFTMSRMQQETQAAVDNLRKHFPKAGVAVVLLNEECACTAGNLSSPQLLAMLAQQWAQEQGAFNAIGLSARTPEVKP